MTSHRQGFWREACAIQGSVTPHVLPLVAGFGAIAAVICGIAWFAEIRWQLRISLAVAPYEIAGAVLGLLLVLRSNAGYERWWEARRLWGGIVNQSRNRAISAMCYGPNDAGWRSRFVKWVAVFPHIARVSLRGESTPAEIASLIGSDEAISVANANHRPSCVALRLGKLLQEACGQLGMDRFAFLQLDRERAQLIDHIGACERILKTPLPLVYAIKVRRFIVLFLVTLPFSLLHRVENDWLVPLVTMLVAYPLVSLDQIGVELQNPFATSQLSHLPLTDISSTIEQNVIGLLGADQPVVGLTRPESDGQGLSLRPPSADAPGTSCATICCNREPGSFGKDFE